jgi:hypothetical protein
MAQNIYQLAISYNAGGQFAANVLHWQFDDAGFATTAAAALSLATAFDTANRTLLRNILNNHVTLLAYRARSVTTPGGFSAVLPFPGGTVGTRASTMLAAGVGPVYILYPIANGVQRGRFFVPGISIGDAIDGTIQTAFATVLATSGAMFKTPITLVGGGGPVATPVIYTRKPVKIGHPVADFQVSNMLGQVRRRQVPVA